MQKGFCLLAGGIIGIAALGCGNAQSGGKGPAAADGPALAVQEFLDAVRKGDDKTSAAMLTPAARTNTAEYGIAVAPPGSDTASFKVGEVEMIGEEGAHVASFWTDEDEQGNKHTDTVVWMVRKEPDGWRIAGMATRVFDDQPAVVLNFEQPEDMLAKQKAIEQEMLRRMGTEAEEPADETATNSLKATKTR
jgi:hypothetical protein